MRLPFFYGWVIVAVVFVSMGIGVNARTAFSLLFPPILDEFRWERAVTAGAFSFGFLVSAIMSPLLGRMMDRVGPRAVMELGVGLMAAGLLLAPLTTEPWHLYATLGVLVGGGSVCLGYSGQSLFLPNWFVRRRGLATGIAFAGVGRRLHRAAALGAARDRERRLAHGLLGHGPAGAGRAGADQPAAAQAPGGHGLAARRRRRAERPARRSRLNVVDPAWAAVDWTLRPRHAHRAASGGSRSAISAGSTPGTPCRCTRPNIWSRSASARPSRPGRWASSAWSAFPARSCSATSPTASAANGCGPSARSGFAVCYLALIALQAFPTPPLLYVMVAAQGALGYGLTSVFAAMVAEIFQGKHYGTHLRHADAGGDRRRRARPWATGALYDAHGSYTLAFWIGVALSWCRRWRSGARRPARCAPSPARCIACARRASP